MKKFLLLSIFIGGLISAQTKNVNTSDIHWWGYKVAKTASSSHNGTVKLKSGTVVMKGNNIVGGTFVLDMTSLTSTDLSGETQAKFNGHLKTGDFFEVEKFPTATYTITSVTRNADKNYPFKVNGNLTAKGVTKAVSFPALIGINKGLLSLKTDKFSFNRQDFGINYQSSVKDVFVRDEIDMQINLQAK